MKSLVKIPQVTPGKFAFIEQHSGAFEGLRGLTNGQYAMRLTMATLHNTYRGVAPANMPLAWR